MCLVEQLMKNPIFSISLNKGVFNLKFSSDVLKCPNLQIRTVPQNSDPLFLNFLVFYFCNFYYYAKNTVKSTITNSIIHIELVSLGFYLKKYI